MAKAKSKIGRAARGRSGLPSTRSVTKDMAAAQKNEAESPAAEENLANLLAKFREILEDTSATLDPGSSTKWKLEYAYAAFRASMEADFSSHAIDPRMSLFFASPLTAFPYLSPVHAPSGLVEFPHQPPLQFEATQTEASVYERRGSDPQVVMPPERPRSTLELASDLLANPGQWLRTPNPNLGDQKPIDLIDTEEEYKVYDLLSAFDQGLFS